MSKTEQKNGRKVLSISNYVAQGKMKIEQGVNDRCEEVLKPLRTPTEEVEVFSREVSVKRVQLARSYISPQQMESSAYEVLKQNVPKEEEEVSEEGEDINAKAQWELVASVSNPSENIGRIQKYLQKNQKSLRLDPDQVKIKSTGRKSIKFSRPVVPEGKIDVGFIEEIRAPPKPTPVDKDPLTSAYGKVTRLCNTRYPKGTSKGRETVKSGSPKQGSTSAKPNTSDDVAAADQQVIGNGDEVDDDDGELVIDSDGDVDLDVY